MPTGKTLEDRDHVWWLSEQARMEEGGDEEERTLEVLRSVRRLELRSRRLVRDLFGGEYHSAFKGQGIEFSEVREYVPGDDVRLIDRNVSARMQHPFVKVFHEEREISVVFLVDQSGSTRFGSGEKSRAEVAAELVAVLAFSAIANNDKVGCLLFSEDVEKWVPPAKGRSHVLRVVREVLFRRPEKRGTNIGAALETATRLLKRRSVIFVVSDFLDRGYETPLAIASRRHEVVPLVLVDPRDRELPPLGLVELEDLETGMRRLVDTSNGQVREAYARAHRDRVERELPERMRRAGVRPVILPMDGDYLQPLHRYFEQRLHRPAEGR